MADLLDRLHALSLVRFATAREYLAGCRRAAAVPSAGRTTRC
jgi:hypothetical protein